MTRLDAHRSLEIQVGDPVDQVEETECSGKKDACVRVYLGDADVQPAVPPRSRAAVLKTAEEAGAVLPVQTLVAVLLVPLLHVRGVVHLNGGGRAWTDVHRGCLLLTGQNNTVSHSRRHIIIIIITNHQDLTDTQRKGGGGVMRAAVFCRPFLSFFFLFF